MKNEKAFLNIITYTPLFLIPLFILIIMILSYKIYSVGFNSSLEDLKKDLLQDKKEAIKNKVEGLSELIVYQKSRIKDELINRVEGRVSTAHKIAHTLYNEYKDTKSDEEIKDIINTTLKTFIWNNNESYIWVMDYYGVHYLLENKKDVKGTSYIDFQDAEGRYIVQEEIAICQEKAKGYLWDTFTKPNENNNKQYSQVAFVKAFEPYEWCLGSAEFLDTATKKTNKTLFDMVKQADKIGNSCVFIVNATGNVLVHSKLPSLVGKDLVIANQLVLDTMEYAKKMTKDKEHVAYIYDWHNSLSGKIEKKYVYLQKIPNTDWLIGSEFLLSEVESQFAKQKVDMLGLYNANTKYLFYIAIIVILASFVFSYFVSKKIKNRFLEHNRNIGEKNKELHELNISLEEKVQERTSELQSSKAKFEILATTDALTCIHNRYSIMQILDNEMSRANRYDSPLSMLMYDIDHFKIVNDNYGHDLGDKTLVSLSNLISTNIRDIDYVGRYGGEEFLIIMPNTILQDACINAERLRKEVEAFHFSGIGKLTISMGVVELREDESIDFIFKRVDELLYISKNNGRNKISF